MSRELSKDKWSKLIRAALCSFAKSAIKERGDIDKTAKALQLSRPSIEKMKSKGTGSVESWIKLAIYKFQLTPEQTVEFLNSLPLLLRQQKKPDDIDLMVEEAKKMYSDQELLAWLKLIISKKQVEEYLGVSINAKLNKKNKTTLKVAEKRKRIKK